MKITDKKLSDRIESRIDTEDFNKKLTQRRVALEFEHGERPFYNKSRMHAAVGTHVSEETVHNRLSELHQKDVLEKEEINNGDVYWLKKPESKWPIPPDVDVDRKEQTVSEWRNQDYVLAGALSMVLAILGTIVTLMGVFQSGGYYNLPIEASDVITYGLSAVIFSYLGFFIAILIWVLDLPELQNIDIWNRND